MDRRRMEIAEAIDAGNRALEGLREAEKKLRSAGRWGLADLFGGGFVFDMIKHSKMESAVGWIDQVRGDLRIFERELKDVQLSGALNLEVGEFLTFADFFFDGMAADFLVQHRISKLKKEVGRAIGLVEDILNQLIEQQRLT